jgi:hypothetical protein
MSQATKPTTTTLLNLLARHRGAANGISARYLAAQLGVCPREMRHLISQARYQEGAAICGHPSTGYYMADEPGELNACCAFLESRALHSLRLLARMRNTSLPDLVGQLNLNQA